MLWGAAGEPGRVLCLADSVVLCLAMAASPCRPALPSCDCQLPLPCFELLGCGWSRLLTWQAAAMIQPRLLATAPAGTARMACKAALPP